MMHRRNMHWLRVTSVAAAGARTACCCCKNSKASGGEDRRWSTSARRWPWRGEARRQPAIYVAVRTALRIFSCGSHRLAVGAARSTTKALRGELLRYLGPARVPWTTCLLKRRTFDIRTPFGNQAGPRRGESLRVLRTTVARGLPFRGTAFEVEEAAPFGAPSCRSSSVRVAPYEVHYRKQCAVHQHVRSAKQLTQRR